MDNKYDFCSFKLPFAYTGTCNENFDLTYSDSCNSFRNIGQFQTVEQDIVLPPRTGCAFWILGMGAVGRITYQMPISMFASNYTIASAEDL